MLTRREFTANSKAAFVSEGPLCTGKKELEGYLFRSEISNNNNMVNTGSQTNCSETCTSKVGTKLAILRIMNASPG